MQVWKLIVMTSQLNYHNSVKETRGRRAILLPRATHLIALIYARLLYNSRFMHIGLPSDFVSIVTVHDCLITCE